MFDSELVSQSNHYHQHAQENLIYDLVTDGKVSVKAKINGSACYSYIFFSL